MRLIALSALALVLAGLATAAWFAFRPGADDAFAGCTRATVTAGGDALGKAEFTLTSETGARLTRAEVIDGPALVYFGYTFCPDVCPADAARNAEIVAALAERGMKVKPVFITIDPERDTPEALAAFTDLIDPGMLGLTGSADELAALRKSFFAYAQRNGTGSDYLMDHSTFSYFMAPGHGVIDLVRHETPAAEAVPVLACYMERLSPGG